MLGLIKMIFMADRDSNRDKSKLKLVSFRLDEEKHEELRIAAIRDKASVNEILNRLVDEYLASRQGKK